MNWSIRYANQKGWDQHFAEGRELVQDHINNIFAHGTEQEQTALTRGITGYENGCSMFIPGFGCSYHSNPEYLKYEHSKVSQLSEGLEKSSMGMLHRQMAMCCHPASIKDYNDIRDRGHEPDPPLWIKAPEYTREMSEMGFRPLPPFNLCPNCNMEFAEKFL